MKRAITVISSIILAYLLFMHVMWTADHNIIIAKLQQQMDSTVVAQHNYNVATNKRIDSLNRKIAQVESRMLTYNEAVLDKITEKDSLVECIVTYADVMDDGNVYTAITSKDGELESSYYDNTYHGKGETVFVPRRTFLASVADTN